MNTLDDIQWEFEPTFQIANKFGTDCDVCGRNVPEKEGLASKGPQDNWFTVCMSRKCIEARNLTPPGEEKRALEYDGEKAWIDMPYDEDALPLLRSLPEARWNPDDSVWEVSADPKDRPRILDIAERLELDVDDAFEDFEADSTIQQHLERSEDAGLYDYQLDGVRFLMQHSSALLGDDMGVGKAQPLDSKILTPDGWERMATITVGDIVMGDDGQPTQVEETFPQGDKEIFCIEFSDGTTAQCCNEHLWDVITPTRKRRNSGYLTLSLEEIQKRGLHEKSGNRKWFIPMTDPVQFPTSELPIDPYVMGVLLGDGSFRGNTPSLSNSEEELIEKVQQRLSDKFEMNEVNCEVRCPEYNFTNLSGELYKLGLHLRKSTTKFIPESYQFGDVQQRRALLAGMLDTDGSVFSSTIEYSSSSKQLADGVKHLVESLGGTARISTRIPTYTYEGKTKKGSRSWRLHITMPNGVNPLSLSRKASSLDRQGKYGPTRSIEAVHYVGTKEAKCIRVGAKNSRYLTNNYVVTHNTVQTIMAIPKTSKTVVTCPNSAKYVWADEVEKWRPGLDVTIPSMDERRPPKEGEIVVVNYSRLPGKIQDDWSTDDIPEQGVELEDGWEGIDVLIGDECHAFKNREAQRTRRFRELRNHAEKVWGLTGTPLSNRPFDLWGTLSSLGLAFDVYGSFQKFLDLFGGRRGRYGIEFRGSPDREASERLRRYMLRRMKEDVLDELPAKTRQDIHVELDGDTAGWLDEVAEVVDFDDKDVELEDLKRMLRSTSLPKFEDFSAFRAKLAEAKYSHAVEIVEEYEEAEEPLVVFSDHRGPVEKLGEREGWACIHGGTPDEERGPMVDAFQNGKLKGIALTIGAGKEGLTLTEASDLLFVDLSWIPGDNAQAEDRIRRIGQEDDACLYKRLVTDHPLDKHIMSLLDEKLEQISEGVEAEIDYEPGEDDEDVEFIQEDADDWEERVQEYQEEKRKNAVSAEERDAVTKAMQEMLRRCDGAVTEDGVGFNGHDAGVARQMMPKLPDNDGAVRYCKQMLQKYRGQIGTQFPSIYED